MSMQPNDQSGAMERTEHRGMNQGAPGGGEHGGGFGSGPDLESAVAPPKALVPQQVFVFLIVFAVSAATIFTMRQYGMQAGIAQAEELRLEFGQADGEKARTYERIMADLRRVEHPLDVALQNLRESPFMPQGADTTVVVGDQQFTGPSAEELAEQARVKAQESRRQLVQTALGTIKVNMVMGDMARINDEYYRVGDQVAEFFTIVKINGREVTLQADGVNYTLVMDEKIDAAPRGGSKFKNPRN
ncbi:MAG: hypothetical protein ACOYN0_14120 [Phycisphaerales bacterium]